MESDLRPRETQRWFVPPKPRTAARVRLFCFPSAGGGADWFSDWPRLLPDEIEVVAAGLAEQGTRRADRPRGDFPTLIHSLAEAIRPLLDLPFALFGHGMGALVAFELARALRRQRQPTPCHLFLSAHPAPHDPGNRRPMPGTTSTSQAPAPTRVSCNTCRSATAGTTAPAAPISKTAASLPAPRTPIHGKRSTAQDLDQKIQAQSSGSPTRTAMSCAMSPLASSA